MKLAFTKRKEVYVIAWARRFNFALIFSTKTLAKSKVYNNFLNRRLSFPRQKRNVPTKYTLFLPQSKTKKLIFRLAAMKFCNSVFRATPAVPTQSFVRLRISTFLDGRIVLLFHQKSELCGRHFDLLSHYDEITPFISNSEAI